MVNIQALEQALLPIQNLGECESTFDVDGTVVAMRMLLPDEEVAAQAFANEIVDFKSDTTERHRVSEYVDRFKIAVLSYSIVQIGDLDLRNLRTIETGEVTDSGQPVKKQKHVVLRSLLGKWTRPVTTAAFGKYTEMLEEVEERTSRAVKFSPSDLDAEVERLEKRLEECKAEKEKRETEAHAAPLRQQLFTLAKEQSEAEKNLMQNPTPPPAPVAEQEPTQEPEPPHLPDPQAAPQEPVQEPQEPVRESQGQRQRAIPQRAAPPTRRPTPEQAPEPEPEPEPAPSFDTVSSSVVDLDTEGVMEDEGQRIARARAQWKQEREAPAQVSRQPPHRQAANTSDVMLDTGGDQLSAARPAGNVDGKEAFRLAPTTLSDRGRGKEVKPNRNAHSEVNKAPQQPTNPRFNPPKR